MDGRDEVIDYVSEKYGRDNVSQIITFGTMAAKAVDQRRRPGARTSAYGRVDRIAKLIPDELGITLDEALEKEPSSASVGDADEAIAKLIDLAQSARRACTRNAGMHAAGVVIATAPLTDYVPCLRRPGRRAVVTQFDKDDVERSGW